MTNCTEALQTAFGSANVHIMQSAQECAKWAEKAGETVVRTCQSVAADTLKGCHKSAGLNGKVTVGVEKPTYFERLSNAMPSMPSIPTCECTTTNMLIAGGLTFVLLLGAAHFVETRKEKTA